MRVNNYQKVSWIDNVLRLTPSHDKGQTCRETRPLHIPIPIHPRILRNLRRAEPSQRPPSTNQIRSIVESATLTIQYHLSLCSKHRTSIAHPTAITYHPPPPLCPSRRQPIQHTTVSKPSLQTTICITRKKKRDSTPPLTHIPHQLDRDRIQLHGPLNIAACLCIDL